MSHYFQDDPNLASNIKKISFEVRGITMELLTDNGVFSKSKVDEGSLAFLKVILPLDLGNNILDLGCGYGTIGLTLAIAKKEARVTLADINTRALTLCKRNADAYNLSQRVTILQSDIYTKIEGKYDSIVINPPIRAGKSVTYKMYEEAKQYLLDFALNCLIDVITLMTIKELNITEYRFDIFRCAFCALGFSNDYQERAAINQILFRFFVHLISH